MSNATTTVPAVDRNGSVADSANDADGDIDIGDIPVPDYDSGRPGEVWGRFYSNCAHARHWLASVNLGYDAAHAYRQVALYLSTALRSVEYERPARNNDGKARRQAQRALQRLIDRHNPLPYGVTTNVNADATARAVGWWTRG